MENIIEKLNEAYQKISIPEEKIVVLGGEAYRLLYEHTTIVYHPEGRVVYKLNGVECHATMTIPPMNFMLLTREEFEQFKKDEAEWYEQLGMTCSSIDVSCCDASEFASYPDKFGIKNIAFIPAQYSIDLTKDMPIEFKIELPSDRRWFPLPPLND